MDPYPQTLRRNNAVAQDIMEEKRPATAMRRPTYAASVFQQARLMEAERQASVAAGAILSGSAITVAPVNGSAANVGHLPPGTPSPLGPRTPELFFPKTPATAFPQGILEVEEPNPLGDPATVAVSVHPLPVQPLAWKQQTLHYICTPGRLVKQQIDPKYVMSMCDPREILFPITFRKVALWIIYGGVITMLVLLDKHYHWWNKLDRAVHGKNLAIMGVLYGFEPMMIIIIMLVLGSRMRGLFLIELCSCLVDVTAPIPIPFRRMDRGIVTAMTTRITSRRKIWQLRCIQLFLKRNMATAKATLRVERRYKTGKAGLWTERVWRRKGGLQ